MSGWSILFWLIITFLLLYPLNRWISSHAQGLVYLLTKSVRVSMWVFWVLFLPGTLLHELSHWLTAKFLLVRTGSFSVWPKMKQRGHLQMGAVEVDGVDVFRHSIIGLAPLIFGSVAVLIIGQGRLQLGQFGLALLDGNVEALWRALENTLSVPDVWLWLYLVFAISNAMLPSASDRESWRTVLIYLGLAFVLVLALGVNPTSSPELQRLGLAILTYLLSAFIITLTVDLFFITLIFFVEAIAGLLLGRRVQYNR
jgi:hypothetical protein